MSTNRFLKHFEFDDKNKVVRYEGPDPKNTKEAFLMSLAKWEFICSLDSLLGVNTGYSDTCGLCIYSEVEDPTDFSCENCPVYKKTGKDDCIGTPHESFTRSHDEEDLRKFSKRELDFLKDLYKSYLEKEKTKTKRKVMRG